jgi:hypothetical protein
MAKKTSKPKPKIVNKAKGAAKTKVVAKSKASGKAPKGRGSVAPTGVKTEARILKTRITESGKTSRIKGHIAAQTRKNQAKRDQKPELSRSKESGKTLPLSNATRTNNMNIEVSTKGGCSAEFMADVTATISQGLARYESRITRIEVHFEDVNGPKGGIDHRCRLEARLSAMKPVIVSDAGADSFVALKGAISKMDRLLKSSLGKKKDVKGTMSASGQLI